LSGFTGAVTAASRSGWNSLAMRSSNGPYAPSKLPGTSQGQRTQPGAPELCATCTVTLQLITLAFKNFDRQLELMGDTPHQRIVRDCQLRKALSVIGNQLVQCID
jgi:hypothetical protein